MGILDSGVHLSLMMKSDNLKQKATSQHWKGYAETMAVDTVPKVKVCKSYKYSLHTWKCL